jgi:hypothetical protein
MEERADTLLASMTDYITTTTDISDNRQLIEKVFSDSYFLEFLQRTEPHHDTISGPQVEFPIAILHKSLSNNLGVNSTQIVRLSLYTIIKQNRNHPEIKMEHYTRILYDIIQYGEVIREKRSHYQHHMLFFYPFIEGGEEKIIKATIKITKDEDKRIYLQSLHFVDLQRFQAERKRGLIVRHTIITSRPKCAPFLDFIDV